MAVLHYGSAKIDITDDEVRSLTGQGQGVPCSQSHHSTFGQSSAHGSALTAAGYG